MAATLGTLEDGNRAQPQKSWRSIDFSSRAGGLLLCLRQETVAQVSEASSGGCCGDLCRKRTRVRLGCIGFGGLHSGSGARFERIQDVG